MNKFDYKNLSFGYTAKIELTSISLNKVARVEARTIVDITSIKKQIKEIILLRVKKDQFLIGDEDLGIELDPESIVLKTEKGRPFLSIDVSIKKFRFIGMNFEPNLDRAINLKIPFDFSISSGSGFAFVTKRPTVTYKNDLKAYIQTIDNWSPGDMQSWLSNKIADQLKFSDIIPIPQLNPYSIEMKSYKVCTIADKVLLDARGTAEIKAEFLNPLIAQALSLSSETTPIVRVIIPVVR